MNFLFGVLIVMILLVDGRKEEFIEYVMGKRENGLNVDILNLSYL